MVSRDKNKYLKTTFKLRFLKLNQAQNEKNLNVTHPAVPRIVMNVDITTAMNCPNGQFSTML